MDAAILTDRLLNLRKIRKFLITFYLVGVAGLSIGFSREIFIFLIPFSLLLSMFLLLTFHNSWEGRHILIFSLVAVSSFIIEAAGVTSGKIFGDYHYGDALGFKVSDTPLIIGLNWLMLIYSIYVITRNHLKLSPIPAITTGAALMVLYDLVLEPVAISTNMWRWESSKIPLQNYLAWFIISMVFLSIFHLFGLKYKNKLAPWLFVIQFLFFLSLALIFKLT